MSDQEQRALAPIEQRQVTFYEDEITAVIVLVEEEQQVYVPIRPICDLLGIDWSAQRQRILRDPVLSEELTPVVVTTTTGTGQEVETLCLPLDYLNGWLFGINANRVKEDVRNRLIRYQRECYQVLAEAFREGRLTGEPAFADLVKGESPAALAYQMASAVMRLARQQLLLESRQDDQQAILEEHARRLETMEVTLYQPGRTISEDQASQISQAVKAVALALGRRSGRNEYGGVYGELYRKFGITSYKNLPANRFSEALDWLTEWHEAMTGDQPF